MSDYNLPTASMDALPQAISPEGAEIANAYLCNACSINLTSKQLKLSPEIIHATLEEPLVKTYVNGVLKEAGFRHMKKIAEKLDDIIDRKMEELDEAEIGSNKDIADLLQMAYKMQSDLVEKLQKDNPKPNTPGNQSNTQVNIYGEGSYGQLMQKLIGK